MYTVNSYFQLKTSQLGSNGTLPPTATEESIRQETNSVAQALSTRISSGDLAQSLRATIGDILVQPSDAASLVTVVAIPELVAHTKPSPPPVTPPPSGGNSGGNAGGGSSNGAGGGEDDSSTINCVGACEYNTAHD